MLKAKVNILYKSRFYAPGEELPELDQKMVEAWINAGSAEYEEAEKPAKAEAPKEAPAAEEKKAKKPVKKGK